MPTFKSDSAKRDEQHCINFDLMNHSLRQNDPSLFSEGVYRAPEHRKCNHKSSKGSRRAHLRLISYEAEVGMFSVLPCLYGKGFAVKKTLNRIPALGGKGDGGSTCSLLPRFLVAGIVTIHSMHV